MSPWRTAYARVATRVSPPSDPTGDLPWSDGTILLSFALMVANDAASTRRHRCERASWHLQRPLVYRSNLMQLFWRPFVCFIGHTKYGITRQIYIFTHSK